MTQGASLLSEQQRQAILNWKGEVVVFPVERGHIARFAEAIGDPNPLWHDEAAAHQTRYGGVIAPPTFLRAARSSIPAIPGLALFDQVLESGSDWEYQEPVRPGDTITCDLRVVRVSQRNLSIGPAVFLVFESAYWNQLGQMVARQRFTLVRYRAKG